jgi:inner membrane protein
MNDSIHILLAVMLVYIFKRRRVPDFLVGVVSVSSPMSDHYLITPLISLGFLPASPLWVHRSITHSLLAGVVIVAVFWRLGYALPSFLGYSAHIVPDFFFGGVKLLLPFDSTIYGFNWSPSIVESIIGLGFVIVVIHGLLGRMRKRNST